MIVLRFRNRVSTPCLIAAGLVCLLLPVQAAAANAVEPLEIAVRARTIAPAELIRIDIRSPEPLDSLACSFLGGQVFMVPDGDPTRWSGWTMIGWDEQPRTVVIEASGTTTDGKNAGGTYALSIKPKAFPEEHLKVEPKYVAPPPEAQARIKEERRLLAEIYASRRAIAPPEQPFERPVPGQPTSRFGTRRVFNGTPRSPHSGLDLRGDEGTPVLAAGPGRVVMARELYYSGNIVILDHGGGLFTLYAHLSRIDVGVGDDLNIGEPVGLVGATGRVTGPHLHWGAKIGNRPFDPTALLEPKLFR